MSPIILFHGTSTHYIDKIKRFGLDKPYLTDLQPMAEYFAQENVQLRGQTPLVLEVRVPETTKLRADFAMYRDPLSWVKEAWGVDTDDEWAQLVQSGELPYARSEREWRRSLVGVHSVWYNGVIPFSNVLSLKTTEFIQDL